MKKNFAVAGLSELRLEKTCNSRNIYGIAGKISHHLLGVIYR